MGTILNNFILTNTSEAIELQSKVKILIGKGLNVDVSQYITLRKQSSIESESHVPNFGVASIVACQKDNTNPNPERQGDYITAGIETVTSDELTTSKDDDVFHKLNKREFALVYTGLMLASFMYCLDNTITLPAISFILADFGKEALLPWPGMYMLTSVPFGVLYGKFLGIFSKKWVYVFALIMFLAGSLVCGLSPTMEVLILGRAIAGVGGGGLVPLAYIVIADITSAKERSKYLAGIGAMVGSGNMLGPLLGGAFTDHLTWRWCFYMNLPVGFLTLAFIVLFCNVPRTPGDIFSKLKHVDFLGSFVLLLTLMAFNIPVLLGGTTWLWSSPQVIALFVLSTMGFIVFIYIEFCVALDPVVPPPIWKNSFIMAMAGISFFVGGVIQSCFMFISLFLEFIDGYTAMQVGGLNVIVCVFYIATVVSSIILSRKAPYFNTSLSVRERHNSDCDRNMYQLYEYRSPFSQFRNVAVSVIGTVLNNLIVTKTADAVELQYAVTLLNEKGYQVGVLQYITLSRLLARIPQAPGAPQSLVSLFEAASDQLKNGFNEAFKYSFLSQLACVVGVLALVPFI
ncbi:MFS general substrate transporter [Rhizoclosmatium globosum]|uniref:MFS general substrate transporter n=1 Tax=Rhizoclosmatium globosum TaxID=329046 RepID=A0A1Y2BQC7_9FUNG|nr:MFS general substrate transporter [Rhizoclosmatium globosum]|eukprot:ORY36926.1 MFS general substrate transporter [Rhizoclosmatium globosum]